MKNFMFDPIPDTTRTNAKQQGKEREELLEH